MVRKAIQEAVQTCKYMAKTTKEPIFWEWRKHLGSLADSPINIIDGF